MDKVQWNKPSSTWNAHCAQFLTSPILLDSGRQLKFEFIEGIFPTESFADQVFLLIYLSMRSFLGYLEEITLFVVQIHVWVLQKGLFFYHMI